MEFVKIILLTLVMGMCTALGIMKANKYKLRVIDLQEIKKALNLAITKMRYTYEPLPELFKEISKDLNENMANIFIKAHTFMETLNAGQAWEKAVDESSNNFTNEDMNIIKGLSKLLGKTDLEGQLMQIELTTKLVDEQIIEATNLQNKNTKLYKTLGATVGLAIMIIFI